MLKSGCWVRVANWHLVAVAKWLSSVVVLLCPPAMHSTRVPVSPHLSHSHGTAVSPWFCQSDTCTEFLRGRRKQCKMISFFVLVCLFPCSLLIKVLTYNSDKLRCLLSLWSSKNWNWKLIFIFLSCETEHVPGSKVWLVIQRGSTGPRFHRTCNLEATEMIKHAGFDRKSTDSCGSTCTVSGVRESGNVKVSHLTFIPTLWSGLDW